MTRNIEMIKGVHVHFLPKQRWYHVFLNPDQERWEVLELVELPEDEDLMMYFNNIEYAIQVAREKNVETNPSVKFIEG